MKNFSCKDLGGGCNQKISAGSVTDMSNQAVNHLRDRHPEIFNAMNAQQKMKWNENMINRWDHTPDL
jgi:predicted small metal-binding protein